jgi:hypothetical protein
MSAAERNSEIWSTRLQRELLALTTDNAPEGTKDDVRLVLPPFVSVKEHELNIEKGDCVVSFLVDLPKAIKKTEEAAAKEEEGDDEKPAGGETAEEAETDAAEPAPIVVNLDVSLEKKADGSVDLSGVAYPFLMPVAVLKSGSERFAEGSTIRDGDMLDIEMDWTPSLHLTDAILNIALKLKESISQSEPVHGPADDKNQKDPVEEIVNRAKRIGSSFSKGLRGLAEKTNDKPEGEHKKMGLRLPGRKKKKEKTKAENAHPGEVRIGDEINMLEAPWVDCQGVYSCKAIRRPVFVDETMAVAAAQNTENKNKKGDQVRSFDAEGDGEVPADLGSFMRLQTGSITQVCLPRRPFVCLIALTYTLLLFFVKLVGKCWFRWGRSHAANLYPIRA